MSARWRRAGDTWCARAADAEEMRALGISLARVLRAGDLIILDGRLGAGKTTFVQGLGAGLGVRGAVTSPTFVIARIHRGPRVDLVHVDAYRLADTVEVDDLDLDAQAEASVMVVEWGAGKVEGLSEQRLHVSIGRPAGEIPGADPAGGERTVSVRGIGPRWTRLDLESGSSGEATVDSPS